MDKYLVDRDEMGSFLKLVNTRIIKNSKIITPDELGQEIVYHIALDQRTRMFPNISKRAGTSEDNTLPRVHVAPNLFGCWFGYASGGYLATNNIPEVTKSKIPNTSNKSSAYKGGFYIHELSFRVGLRPNKELVYDADFTEEIWLCTYNEMTKVFPATIVGLLFVNFVSYYPRTNKKPIEVTSLCVRVDKGKQVILPSNFNAFISQKKKLPSILKEGFYMFDISEQYGITEFKSIKEKDFNEYKLRAAAMLSYS